MLKIKLLFLSLLLCISLTIGSVELSKEYKIGHTTEYYDLNILNHKVVTPTYYSNSRMYSPRKSPERPYDPNEGFLEYLEDWARMKGWGLAYDSNWPSYVDKDYWDEFLAQYPEYEDEARKWFEEYQQNNGEIHPKDPFTPVGDIPIILILMFCILYAIKKNDTIAQW